MRIPAATCQIEITCALNPSEDADKLKTAITNIFPNVEISSELFSVTAHSKELYSFEKIHESIHSKKTLNSYKRNLEKNLDCNTTWFYLNKQAAFVNQVAICQDAQESPLGPIKVTITSPTISTIIDWLAS